MNVRTRCWWAMSVEYGELASGRRFPPKQKGAVFKSNVRPAILYASESWCLRESEMGILQRAERSMVRAMCGVQLKERKTINDMILVLGFNEARY